MIGGFDLKMAFKWLGDLTTLIMQIKFVGAILVTIASFVYGYRTLAENGQNSYLEKFGKALRNTSNSHTRYKTNDIERKQQNDKVEINYKLEDISKELKEMIKKMDKTGPA